ncbi:MAG: hypothetical protein Q9220_002545 [cf. Caloplaca sp. 1 TL-2023]
MPQLDAGIAWPNARMWHQWPQQQHAPPSPCKLGTHDVDAHAHSPRRREGLSDFNRTINAGVVAPTMLSHLSMPPPARRNLMIGDTSWISAPVTQDQFIENCKYSARRQSTQISISDDSMPDYSHSITPRSSRDASLRHMQDVPDPHPESQFEELMAAYSPVKAEGTLAPPTTRISSASTTPTAKNHNSGLTEHGAGSYHGQARVVSMTTRDAPPPATRDPSDISMRSRFSDGQVAEGDYPTARINQTPASEVKGRKEGKSGDANLLSPGGRQRALTGSEIRQQKGIVKVGEEDHSSASDSKRKRASVRGISELLSDKSEGHSSSPVRKASRTGDRDGWKSFEKGGSAEESMKRSPLGSLENR